VESKAGRSFENSKEMTGYKAAYADLTFSLPRELIEIRPDASNEEKMVRVADAQCCVIA
jgi:hypothetical protein